MDFYSILVYVVSYIGFFISSFYILSLFDYYRQKKVLSKRKLSVSVLIPAYNEEASIVQTLESALSTEYPRDKFEIVVIDDGSKDGTLGLARNFAAKHKGVKVFTKQNGGKGTALNYGIANSSGEIIITMDADTFIQPDTISKMVSYFYSPKVMAVTPSMGVYKPRGFWERIQQIEYYLGTFLRKAFSSINAIHITPGAFSAYRREFFDRYGGYDEKNITEDLEISLRMQRHNFIIENAPEAAVYTIAPKSFNALMVQRRRWYSGLMKNLWSYRDLFGFKRGPLGLLVLPAAIVSVVLSIILIFYSVTLSLSNLRTDILSLSAVNFHFGSIFTLNYFLLGRFFSSLFSEPIFLVTLFFIVFLSGYLYFSRKVMGYREGLVINFIFFVFVYAFLSTFWWIVSLFYVAFNKKVVWRKDG